MIISDVLNKRPLKNPEDVIACSERDSVRAAVARFSERNIGAVVVLSDHTVAGIFTQRDVIVGLSRHGESFLDTPLSEVTVRKVIVVAPAQPVSGALKLMNDHKVGHLPVVDGNALVGLLSMRDLAMQQLDAVEQTVEFLKNQVHLGSHPLPM